MVSYRSLYNLKNSICIMLLYFIVQLPLAAAELTASVDRNPVVVDESFIFNLSAKGSVDGEPDFTLLQNDFQILRQSQSSNMSYINGSMSREKTWTLVLISKKTGSFIIPEISVGSDKSQAFNLTVVKSNNSSSDSDQNRNLYMEMTISAKSVYVQQELIVNLKIFRAVRISNAQLTELKFDVGEALIDKVGDVKEYEELINGRRYIIIEQEYALFPQKSGDLSISPITFTAEIVKQRQSIFSFDPFNQNNEIKRLQSQSVTITIKPIPESFTKVYPASQWLPVRRLQLDETWSVDTNALKTGEPVTRTITINADGMSGTLLPDILMKVPDSIKAYPDKAITSNNSNGTGRVGSKQFKIALLATSKGRYQIPATSIVWWNTQKNALEKSLLPARTITVIRSTTHESKQETTATPTTKITRTENINNSVANISNHESTPWFWITLCGVLAIAWLMTLLMWWKSRQNSHAGSLKQAQKNKKVTVTTKKIKKSCLNNDPQASCAALLEWANFQTESNKFTNLAMLYPYASDKLFLGLKDLETVLYQSMQRKRKWDGDKFWKLFNKDTPRLLLQQQPTHDPTILAPLYPETAM